jgi:hypothetical protein
MVLQDTMPAHYNRVEVPCAKCGRPMRKPPWALDNDHTACYECDPANSVMYSDPEDPITSINGIELVAEIWRGKVYLGTRRWTGDRTTESHPQDVPEEDTDEADEIRRRNQVVMVSPDEARAFASKVLTMLGGVD